jgi:hypothetical protein
MGARVTRPSDGKVFGDRLEALSYGGRREFVLCFLRWLLFTFRGWTLSSLRSFAANIIRGFEMGACVTRPSDRKVF